VNPATACREPIKNDCSTRDDRNIMDVNNRKTNRIRRKSVTVEKPATCSRDSGNSKNS
jgi:hypothetical protein